MRVNSFPPDLSIGTILELPVENPPVDGLHPHVVLIPDDEHKRCFLVPGFTKGKYKVVGDVQALIASGFSEDQVCAHIDNAARVAPSGGWKGHECTYVTYRFFPQDSDELMKKNFLGKMDNDGVKMLIVSMLQLSQHPNSPIPPKLVKKLKKILAKL